MDYYYIIIVLLIIGIIACMGTAVYLGMRSEVERKNSFLTPFSGRLAPSSIWNPSSNSNNPGIQNDGVLNTPEEGLYLTGMRGGVTIHTPQIICPPNHKINIVAAYLDVIDPYGECSNTPDPTLQRTCGYNPQDPSTEISCSSKGDCGVGMDCQSNKCVPKSCISNSDCTSTSSDSRSCDSKLGTTCENVGEKKDGLICVTSDVIDGNNYIWVADPGSGDCMACIDPDNEGLPPPTGEHGFCASMPTCMLVNEGLNYTCSPGSDSNDDENKCRPRDASAYLAKHCNGKNVCLGSSDDVWKPNLQAGVFGPLPCKIKADSSDSNYLTLPIISGWSGGTPPHGDKPNAPSFSQGYYCHGFFTCQPDNS